MVSRIKPIKITVVGDGVVGKTSMLITYTQKEFPTGYIPICYALDYVADICVDGEKFTIILWDTAGQKDHDRVRPLSYPGTDCFLLCFSISARSSYENVASKWYPEIKHHCPNVPIVLVGTKGDLRNNEDLDIVTQAECKGMKKKIKAFRYVECSAAQQEGLEEVLIEAVRALLEKFKEKPATRRFCDIL